MALTDPLTQSSAQSCLKRWVYNLPALVCAAEASAAAVEAPVRPRGLWGLTGRSRSVSPSGLEQASSGVMPVSATAEASSEENPSASGRGEAPPVTMGDVTATLQVLLRQCQSTILAWHISWRSLWQPTTSSFALQPFSWRIRLQPCTLFSGSAVSIFLVNVRLP